MYLNEYRMDDVPESSMKPPALKVNTVVIAIPVGGVTMKYDVTGSSRGAAITLTVTDDVAVAVYAPSHVFAVTRNANTTV